MSNSIVKSSAILGPDGNPFNMGDRTISIQETKFKEAVTKMFTTFTSSIMGQSYDQSVAVFGGTSNARTYNPLETHPWVYAAAMAVAKNRSQAHYRICQEKPDEKTQSYRIKRGAKEIRRGSGRRAFRLFHDTSGRKSGLPVQSHEEMMDHPLSDVFDKPNDLMDGTQLWQVTDLWMMIRGECFWIFLDENFEPCFYWEHEKIKQIWPVAPQLVYPLVQGNSVVGWRMNTLYGMTNAQRSNQIFVDMEECVQFKFINPNNPVRGLAPLASASLGIFTDLLAKDRNRGLLENGCDPGGFLVNEEGTGSLFKDDNEAEKFRQDFEQRHQGPRNSRRVGLLKGGWKYIPAGLSNEDMQFMESLTWNRDEALAVMGVPKSVLAITDGLNYATQVAQDKNFWEKSLLPLTLYYERALDSTIFFRDPDDITGMFDLSKIDALRGGQSDKIDVAKKLVANDLHVPPSIAFQMVGLEVPEYVGDDETFIPPTLTTVSQLLEDIEAMAQQGQNEAELVSSRGKDPGAGVVPADSLLEGDPTGNVQTTGNGSPSVPVGSNLAPQKTPVGGASVIRMLASNKRASRKKTVWNSIIRKVQTPMEKRMSPAWRNFVAGSKRIALARFDSTGVTKSMSAVLKDFDPNDVIENLVSMKQRLVKSMTPAYTDGLHDTYNFTADEVGGVPLFTLDDPAILDILDDRVNIQTDGTGLVGSAPATIQNQLRKAIKAGIENGDTVQQIRARVAKVFDIAGSSSKTLQIARTESSGFMNALRDAMFSAQGIEEEEWTTAGDEHVRPHHVIFGNSGPHPRGFNYMTLVKGSSGSVLTYPGDPDGDASEVVNCRCVKIPIL